MKQTSSDPLVATETWFLQHGLPYFVPEERAAARAGSGRAALVPLVVVLSPRRRRRRAGCSAGSPTSTQRGAGAVVVHRRARPGLATARPRCTPGRSWASPCPGPSAACGCCCPIASRALPLLLVFVTFLFINAEAWQMTTPLPFGRLWLAVLLLLGLGVVFLLVRLPEEVDQVDDAVDDSLPGPGLSRVPLWSPPCADLVADHDPDPQRLRPGHRL